MIAALAGTRGGPRTYAVEIARRLPDVAPDLDITWLSEVPAPEVAALSRASLALPHPVLRPLWDHLGVPGVLRRRRVDLFHHTKNALPLRARGARVVTIHDLAWRIAPETFSAASRLYLELSARHAARTADAVITVSRSTRRDLVRLYDIPSDRVHVVPNGVAERFRTPGEDVVRAARRELGLPRRYVLFAGTIQARKNPDVVLAAWLGLPGETRRMVPLVFAGRLGWKYGAFLRRFAEVRGAEDVRLLTAVPDRLMPALYAGAEAFVSPSGYEGFGLTFLEAMAAGTPVVAGDTSSVPEVVGDAGILVPPRDVVAVRRALVRLLGEPGLAEDLSRRGIERAGRFGWERSARGTADVYRAVLAASS